MFDRIVFLCVVVLVSSFLLHCVWSHSGLHKVAAADTGNTQEPPVASEEIKNVPVGRNQLEKKLRMEGISEEAKAIILEELLSLVKVMSNPPARVTEEGRNDFAAACFAKWRRDVIRIGEHYDRSIEDGQRRTDTFLYPHEETGFAVAPSDVGTAEGYYLISKWVKQLSDEISKRYLARISNVRRVGELQEQSRDEIIKDHPNIEAIISLSRWMAPQKKEEVVAIFHSLACEALTLKHHLCSD